MKKRLRIIVPVIAIVAVIVIFSIYSNGKNGRSNMASGNIEITEVTLSFRIPGRLEKRLVDEGDPVKAGQVVAYLEKEDQQLAVERAKASLENARSVLAELEAGSRPEEIERAYARVLQAQYLVEELQKGSRVQEIASSQADLERAKAAAKAAEVQLAQAKSDYERFATLYKSSGISQKDYEAYRTRYETAVNADIEAKARIQNAKEGLSLRQEGPRAEEIKKAQAGLKQAQAEYELVKSGPRKETVDQARTQVSIAEIALEQAKQQLKYTELVSPTDGVVLSTSAEAGEFLNPAAPVINVGDIGHPWLRAYISETELGKIKLKDKVKVFTDTYPNKSFPGVIGFISSQAEFTPKSVQTFEERVKLMYRIKVDLENPNQELKPGMPADVIFKEHDHSESTKD